MQQKEVVVTQANWFHVVQKLNPEQPLVIDGSRRRPVFVLSGYDGRAYRVQQKELQALMITGKLPIWLLARLVESDVVQV